MNHPLSNTQVVIQSEAAFVEISSQTFVAFSTFVHFVAFISDAEQRVLPAISSIN
jgi:hypothetical protein